jgi:hypothetical protein
LGEEIENKISLCVPSVLLRDWHLFRECMSERNEMPKVGRSSHQILMWCFGILHWSTFFGNLVPENIEEKEVPRSDKFSVL